MSRPTARRPTLEEVAARAGVGRGTASRVINGGDKVSAHARLAVEEAIQELGYVPNPAARSLVKGRTEAVALVIAEPEERIFGEPFFAGVIRGIGSALTEADRQLVLILAQSGHRSHLDRFITRQHVDGVLLLSLHDDDTLPEEIRSRGLDVVLGGRPANAGPAGFVDVDNAFGARQAVEHLLSRGRRRIATIAGPADMVAGRERLLGYTTALGAAGLTVDDTLVEHGDFSQPGGEEAMRVLLDRRPDLDAVFCGNDLMAAGALRALRDAGRHVPEDVAVVGFDDAALAATTVPPLTTVHQSPEEMGREMVALLLATMSEPGDPPPARVLPTELVVRGSS